MINELVMIKLEIDSEIWVDDWGWFIFMVIDIVNFKKFLKVVCFYGNKLCELFFLLEFDIVWYLLK